MYSYASVSVEICMLSVSRMHVQGKAMVLKTVLKYMELKATMNDVNIPGLSPGDITFLGVVSSKQYRSIIIKAKVLVVVSE